MGEVKRATLAEEAVIEAALRFDDSELQKAFAEGYERGWEMCTRSTAALRRELEAEKARFEEHHAAWLENHKYLAGRAQDAITTLIDIAHMSKKAGSESAKHRLTQLGIDWESGEPLRDYGRMT